MSGKYLNHENYRDDYRRRSSRSRSPVRGSRKDDNRRRSKSRSRSRSRGRDRDSRYSRNDRIDRNERTDRDSRRENDRDNDRMNNNSNISIDNRRNSSSGGRGFGRDSRNSGKSFRHGKYDDNIPVNEVLVESTISRPKFDWKTALLPAGNLEDGEEAETMKKMQQDEEVIDQDALKALDKFIEAVGDSDESDEDGIKIDDDQRILEESRRRREEILKKYQARDTLHESMEISGNLSPSALNESSSLKQSKVDHDDDDDDDYEAVNLYKRMRSASVNVPSIDVSNGDAMYQDQAAQIEAARQAVEDEENQRGKVFDMFSSSPSDVTLLNPLQLIGNKLNVRKSATLNEGENHHLQSNWDDSDGYYKARIGEVIADRYRTLGIVGKGVFSTVLKCIDLRPSRPAQQKDESVEVPVAIKLIRNNDTMRKAADKERQLLYAISERDPDNKKHCVKLFNSFEYRSHIAFVFEYQAMNLRETLKKYGKDVGINIGAIKLYGRQLFIALKLLSDLKIVHADIKLDNILCSDDLKQVKLCDFGSGFKMDDPDIAPTPYLVSRFYRAPEIILGLPYDTAIDLWSVCVSLYELFTGHVMFPGRTNNDMLRLIQLVKGKFPNKVIKSHLRSYETLQLEPHFEPDLRFRQYENDPVTGKSILKLVEITHPIKDLNSILRSNKAGADDSRLVAHFADLIERGLALEPSKRLTVSDALKHPFFSAKL